MTPKSLLKPGFHRSPRPPTRTDLAILLLILAAGLSITWYFWHGAVPGREIVVSVDNLERYRFSLEKDGEHTIRGRLGPMRIRIEGGRARVTASGCPLKICMKMGGISRSGQSIICLPNRVVIRVVGEEQNSNHIDLLTQ